MSREREAALAMFPDLAVAVAYSGSGEALFYLDTPEAVSGDETQMLIPGQWVLVSGGQAMQVDWTDAHRRAEQMTRADG